MASDKNMARRGVQRRLQLGAACAMGTVLTFVTGILMGGSFAMAAMMILSLCFLVSTLAFVLSARREETVHHFANTVEPKLIVDDGVDGSLEPSIRRG